MKYRFTQHPSIKDKKHDYKVPTMFKLNDIQTKAKTRTMIEELRSQISREKGITINSLV